MEVGKQINDYINIVVNNYIITLNNYTYKVEVWYQEISAAEKAIFSYKWYSNCKNMISLEAEVGIPQDFQSSGNSFFTFITDLLKL